MTKEQEVMHSLGHHTWVEFVHPDSFIRYRICTICTLIEFHWDTGVWRYSDYNRNENKRGVIWDTVKKEIYRISGLQLD